MKQPRPQFDPIRALLWLAIIVFCLTVGSGFLTALIAAFSLTSMD